MKIANILKVWMSVSLLSTVCIPSFTFAEPKKSQLSSVSNTFNVQFNGVDGKKLWKISDINITADATEDTETSIQIDGGAGASFSGSYAYSEEGKHTATIYWKDSEGKELGQVSQKIKLDKTKPKLQVQAAGLEGENGWLRSDAEISIGAEDPVSKLTRVDFGFDTKELKTYDSLFTVTQEGVHYITAEAEDNAGNIEKLEQPFYIDKTKPVISNVYLQNEYYWGQDFPVSFQTSDAISGVASINATINGRAVANGSSYRFTEPGWHTYRIEVKDTAGWKAVYETKFEVYIPAKISFHPDSLQLDHGTGMATNIIELPAPFEPELIRFSTVQTNGKTVHVQDPQYGYVQNPIGDEDENGIRDMKLKYEREALVPVIAPQAGEDKWKPTMVIMYGDWGDYHFKGYDDFSVINSGYVPPPPDVTPPGVTMVPQDHETNVSVDVTPILTFTELIILNNQTELSDTSAQGILRFTNQQGEEIPFTANWMKNTPSIQVNPNVQLAGNTTYTIELEEKSVMDAVYNPQLSVVDAVYNTNAAFRSSFTTENYTFVYPPPLPIPVIEIEVLEEEPPIEEPPIEEPPVVTVSPRTLPLPPKPPLILSEWQMYLNNVVAREIALTTDENFIAKEVNRVLDTLETYVASDSENSTNPATLAKKKVEKRVFNNGNIMTKFDVLDHTVTTVMKKMVEKMKKEVVSPEQVAASTYQLLRIGYAPLMKRLPEDDSFIEIDRAVVSVTTLLHHVVRGINKVNITTELAEELNNVVPVLVEKQNLYKVPKKADISDLNQKVTKIKKNIQMIRNQLGDKVSIVSVPYTFPVYLKGKHDTQVTLQPKAVENILEANVSLSVENQEQAGITLPAEWLKRTGPKRVQISLKKGTKEGNVETESQEYEYQVKVDNKWIQQVTDGVVIEFPYESKSQERLRVYYYDDTLRDWRELEDKDGEPVAVKQSDGFVSFSSTLLGTFRITE